MEFDIADPQPLPIMEFSIILFIFLNEGFPNLDIFSTSLFLIELYMAQRKSSLYFSQLNILKN